MQLLRKNVFIFKVFILIQVLSTANVMDIITDYYITNSTLASSYYGSNLGRVGFFIELFRIIVKMCPLCK